MQRPGRERLEDQEIERALQQRRARSGQRSLLLSTFDMRRVRRRRVDVNACGVEPCRAGRAGRVRGMLCVRILPRALPSLRRNEPLTRSS